MSDSDDEDFTALFFDEARELLEALQEHLNALADGDTDPEVVNAAFRAVHSVKGGAAAFGYEGLAGFAHGFETVMDALRNGELDPAEAGVVEVLQRAGDRMHALVEAAAAGRDAPADDAGLAADLAALTTPAAPKAATAAPSPQNSAANTPEAEVLCRVTPGPSFTESGHDMLRLIRAARRVGLKDVHVDGALPPLDQVDPTDCRLSWDLSFRPPGGPTALEEFFAVYGHTAQIEILPSLPGPPRADTPPDTERPDQSPVARETGDKYLRVELSRIDRLVNLVGEMLITQAANTAAIETAETASAASAQTVDVLSRQLRELQETVMAIRAQPVKSVFRRMPRLVRDLSQKLGKPARLELGGEQTEVDATVIEELAEPLTHMIRNAMDHGLEDPATREAAGKPATGEIRLSAEHRGERVVITVADDGAGVDRERVLAHAVSRGLVGADEHLNPEDIDLLIFRPGFSTSDTVSDVSGRGVGMDVVKKKILAMGGRCTFSSTPGAGTVFQITLPLTLAVMDGMTVAVDDQRYVLPLSSVVEALRLTADDGRALPDGTQVLERRGTYMRMFDLRGAMGLPRGDRAPPLAVVVETEAAGPVAVTVDQVIGQRQIVLKSLEANYGRIEGIAGATILGDGQVALILDIPGLMEAQAAPPRQELMH
ncbi:MAG: chemotaxis protein CheA [Pseudomonadota bacterium]